MVGSFCRVLAMLLLVAVSLSPAIADDSFPFGTTLMFDAAPMRGSKRVPMLEIAEDGAASIDLWWCERDCQSSCQRRFNHDCTLEFV